MLYYSLPLLCLMFCAVTRCETDDLYCKAKTLIRETPNSTEKTTTDYYCLDGALANYDGHSARYHCCTVSLKQGKCPGECREPRRNIRSLWDQPTVLRNFVGMKGKGHIVNSMGIPVPKPKPSPTSTKGPFD